MEVPYLWAGFVVIGDGKRKVNVSTNTTITAQRTKIFDKTVAKVMKDYFDPKFKGVDWPKIARELRGTVLSIAEPEAFELAMHDLVRTLGTCHAGFFHHSVRRVPARLAIEATFGKTEGEIWKNVDHARRPRGRARPQRWAPTFGYFEDNQWNSGCATKSADVSDGY